MKFQIGDTVRYENDNWKVIKIVDEKIVQIAAVQDGERRFVYMRKLRPPTDAPLDSAYFLEAFGDDGKAIPESYTGEFAGRGGIYAKDFRRSKIYQHIKFAPVKGYPRYARVKYFEIQTMRSKAGTYTVLETVPNRYYRERSK